MPRFRTWADTTEAPVVSADRNGRYISLVWPCVEIKLTLPEASELAEKLAKAGKELIKDEFAKYNEERIRP